MLEETTPQALTAEEELHALYETVGDGNYIFRGENKDYGKIACGLYRTFENSDAIIQEKFTGVMEVLETENTLKEIAKYFPTGEKNICMLAKAQHYGMATSLIDFTKNINIALFFACHGNHEKDGRLIFFDMDETKEYEYAEEIYDEDYEKKKIFLLFEPFLDDNRLSFQQGVFVHAKKGFIDEHADKDICLLYTSDAADD